ncbi:MAG TPA: endonuclease III [Candidatus Binataceae bacterium]|nr:endonuclease III [Candidatus Binataceae bacterium]
MPIRGARNAIAFSKSSKKKARRSSRKTSAKAAGAPERPATARAGRVAATLARLYPEARISLDFSNAWECLVATILSAQCTDARVNRTTPALFRALPTPAAMARAKLSEIERLVAPTGFFRQKAKALNGCARKIVEQFGGEVPRTMEELVTLPGVGRKTANVILGHVYGTPGLVVDTHVRRVAFRLGLTEHREADKIELDLQRLLPPAEWTPFSMRLILHGRQVCSARRPDCEACALRPECPRIGVAD